MTDSEVGGAVKIVPFHELIARAEYRALIALAEALEAYDEKSEDDFALAIDAAVVNRFTQAELAAEFKVAEGTISRWRSGKSCPPSYARKTIVARLREKMLASMPARVREVVNKARVFDKW